MRISDWSSDVCSSDLQVARRFEQAVGLRDLRLRRFDIRLPARHARLRRADRQDAARGDGIVRHALHAKPGRNLNLRALERVGEPGLAPDLARHAIAYGVKDRKSTRLNSSH